MGLIDLTKTLERNQDSEKWKEITKEQESLFNENFDKIKKDYLSENSDHADEKK
jgi:hypothetical protein